MKQIDKNALVDVLNTSSIETVKTKNKQTM